MLSSKDTITVSSLFNDKQDNNDSLCYTVSDLVRNDNGIDVNLMTWTLKIDLILIPVSFLTGNCVFAEKHPLMSDVVRHDQTQDRVEFAVSFFVSLSYKRKHPMDIALHSVVCVSHWKAS